MIYESPCEGRKGGLQADIMENQLEARCQPAAFLTNVKLPAAPEALLTEKSGS